MPRALLLSCATLLFASAALAAETQSVVSFKRTVTKTIGYEYLLALPTGYDAASDKKWPVILFLHGSGERGTDPWLVAKHGPPKLIRGDGAAASSASTPAVAATKTAATAAAPVETPEARARREEAAAMLRAHFIVISPQCPPGTWWNDETVLALLDDVMAKHKTDAGRVYLTGLSMGGYGTWSVGLKNSERFAAIVPICGGGQSVDALRLARDPKSAALRLGVWVFHGAKDPTVPLEESERMVAALKKAGVTDLQFTVYPEAKHDSWTETYANPALYTWLLRHERPERR